MASTICQTEQNSSGEKKKSKSIQPVTKQEIFRLIHIQGICGRKTGFS